MRAAWTIRRKTAPTLRPAARAQGTNGRLALYALSFNAPAQFASWLEPVERAEPRLLKIASPRVLLDHSTDQDRFEEYAALCSRYGFEHKRLGNLDIVGGRVWCARHFAEQTSADFMVFFEDNMLLHTDPGVCRNGLPTVIPEVVGKAAQIHAIKNHARRVVRGGGDLLLELADGSCPAAATSCCSCATARRAKFEQTLMVHALELTRSGDQHGAVLLASPINHDRQVHYPAGARKES